MNRLASAEKTFKRENNVGMIPFIADRRRRTSRAEQMNKNSTRVCAASRKIWAAIVVVWKQRRIEFNLQNSRAVSLIETFYKQKKHHTRLIQNIMSIHVFSEWSIIYESFVYSRVFVLFSRPAANALNPSGRRISTAKCFFLSNDRLRRVCSPGLTIRFTRLTADEGRASSTAQANARAG